MLNGSKINGSGVENEWYSHLNFSKIKKSVVFTNKRIRIAASYESTG